MKLINMYQKTFKEMQNSTNLTEDEQKILANIIFYVVGKQYAEADD